MGFFVIIPFFIGSGIWSVLGLLSLISSFFLHILSLNNGRWNKTDKIFEHRERKKIYTKESGIIFIGPIPIVFGLNRNIINILVAIGIIYNLFFIIFI